MLFFKSKFKIYKIDKNYRFRQGQNTWEQSLIFVLMCLNEVSRYIDLLELNIIDIRTTASTYHLLMCRIRISYVNLPIGKIFGSNQSATFWLLAFPAASSNFFSFFLALSVPLGSLFGGILKTIIPSWKNKKPFLKKLSNFKIILLLRNQFQLTFRLFVETNILNRMIRFWLS